MNYAHLDNTGKVASQRGGPYEGYVKCPAWVQVGDTFDGTNWHEDPERRAASIKAQAERIILGRFPTWKQLNMARRHAELQSKIVVIPGTEQARKKKRLEDDFAWIDAVAAESDRLEADPNATPNWPEYE